MKQGKIKEEEEDLETDQEAEITIKKDINNLDQEVMIDQEEEEEDRG